MSRSNERGFRSFEPDWEVDGRDWPHRSSSKFLVAGGLRWHVQTFGCGPPLLLVHGAGASSHSFRDLAPRLADRFTLVIPDLPGHGFTETPRLSQLGLPAMGKALSTLVERLGLPPRVTLGHSSGAAVLLRSILDGALEPRLMVGVNAAIYPPGGVAGRVFSPAARFAIRNPIATRFMAWRARDRKLIRRTIEVTGSSLDERGIELYQRLARRPGHVRGTVGMMAEWDLEPLVSDLPNLKVPMLLLVGGQDRAVPPKNSYALASTVSNVEVVRMPGLGHLSHEESPSETASVLLDAFEKRGLLGV